MDTVGFTQLSRRAFLVSSGATAIAIAFGQLPRSAFGQTGEFQPSGWVSVATDGEVTICAPAAEMGQGVMTALPLLLAEEMDLDWSLCRVLPAPYDPAVFGNPLFTGAMRTVASRSTRGYYEVIRLAGMQAREIMIANAAQRMGIAAEELETEPHHVVHRRDRRRLSYGEIAAFAQVPAQPPTFTPEQLKPMSGFRLVGKDVARVDIPDKVVGRATYGIDVQQPGMLYGAILRAPVNGESPIEVNDAEARAVAGVHQIVVLPYGVGVIADTYPAALKAKRTLKVTWSRQSAARSYNPDRFLPEWRERVRNLADPGVPFETRGDPHVALQQAATRVVGEYTSLNVTHACMEPMNCTARVDGAVIEFWVPTQVPSAVLSTATTALGFEPENVRLNTTLLGGGFGRRAEDDFVVDAGLLAKAMPGRAVKVIWEREDDIRYTKPRPMTVQRLEAGLDARGRLVALHHRIAGESIYRRFAAAAFQASGGKDPPLVEGAYELTYGIPNTAVEQLFQETGVDVAIWRSVGGGYTKFALETFIEEVAAAAHKDPIDFRIELLDGHPRGQAVIRKAVGMARWGSTRPEGRALGLGYSDLWGTFVATVAEASVHRTTGKVTVHEIWTAVDPGVTLQPQNVQAQIESAIAWGLSALHEKLIYVDGEPQQSNFHDYPVLRMDQMPKVTTHVMVTDNKPGGIGEVGLPPVAPAVANAVFHLTGVRLRDLPFNPDLLKS